MKQPVFEGTCTALITPFAEHQINYELFDTLLARQIQAGVSAVAVCATTGEAATMSDREQTALIAHCVTAANGACKVIAGTGTNDTVHAIEKAKPPRPPGPTRCSLSRPTITNATVTACCAIIPPWPTRCISLSFSTTSPPAPAYT